MGRGEGGRGRGEGGGRGREGGGRGKGGGRREEEGEFFSILFVQFYTGQMDNE